jgi:hypothetical protein
LDFGSELIAQGTKSMAQRRKTPPKYSIEKLNEIEKTIRK